MAKKSGSSKKSGNTRRRVDSGEKEKLIAELKKRIAVLENELKSKMGTTGGNDSERKLTERKRAQQAFLLSHISDAVIGMDPDFNIIYWSPSAEKMYGYSAEEVLGRPSIDVFKPDYLGMRREEVIERLRSTGHIRVEAAHVTKDDSRIIVESHSQFLYDEKGEPYCLLGTNRDITDRKRTEKALLEQERFRNIFETPLIGASIGSPEKGWILANDKICEMLGYTRDELKQLTWDQLTHPDDLKKDVEQFNRLLSGEIDNYTIDKRFIRKDGSVVYTTIFVGAVRKADGTLDYDVGFMLDMTERKRAEEALRKSQSRLEAVFKSMAEGVIIFDSQGNIIDANDSALKIFDYCHFDNMHKSPGEYTPAYDLYDLNNNLLPQGEWPINRTLRGESFTHYEVVVKRTDIDHTRILSYGGIPIRDPENNIAIVVQTIEDITERKRAEESLQENEEKFRALAETSSPAIFVYQDEHFVYVNPSAEQITGYNKEELLEMKFWDIIHPDDREMGRERGKARLRGETVPPRYEAKYQTKDGRDRILEINATTMYYNGRLAGLATALDITERKQAEEALRVSEERFRALADNIPNLAWMANPDGWIFWYNKQWYDYTGTTLEETQGWGWQKVLHPDDVQKVNERWRSSIEAGRLHENTTLLRGKDGNYRWFLVRVTPIRDEQGNIQRWFGTNTDITERKRAEEALKEAKAQAELYVDLMGHDINNMNHSAMGYLELALQALETERRLKLDDKVLIERPIHALANSSALIKNVRKLQRLMAEGVKTRPTDLNQIFRELEEMSFHLDGRDVLINIQHIPDIMVDGNELLKDVFVNLITNALKHSDEEKPLTINVKVETVNENGQKYCLCVVEDDGPGIHYELKDKLFHRFQRGATKAHGKGLGLYLVRTLVEGYNGKVWVEDRVAGDHTKGARFVVMLPEIDN